MIGKRFWKNNYQCSRILRGLRKDLIMRFIKACGCAFLFFCLCLLCGMIYQCPAVAGTVPEVSDNSDFEVKPVVQKLVHIPNDPQYSSTSSHFMCLQQVNNLVNTGKWRVVSITPTTEYFSFCLLESVP